MILDINGNTTIAHIQEKFEEYFPFLMLQFYYPKAKHAAAHTDLKKIRPEVQFRVFNSTLTETIIKFGPETKTGELEQEIVHKCGVPVHILRCQGDEWIPTFADDNLTLDEQNQIGQSAMEQWMLSESAWIEREKFL
jgi:hypothetical protein